MARHEGVKMTVGGGVVVFRCCSAEEEATRRFPHDPEARALITPGRCLQGYEMFLVSRSVLEAGHQPRRSHGVFHVTTSVE